MTRPPASGAESPRHRVVIIGAGFSGLFAARALRRAPLDVTVVDRTNYHLFEPLVYQVPTGVLSVGAVAPTIRDVCTATRTRGCCSARSSTSTLARVSCGWIQPGGARWCPMTA